MAPVAPLRPLRAGSSRLRALLALAALAVVTPPDAAALEQDPGDARYLFAFGFTSTSSAGTTGVPPVAAGGGIYVIGDSISWQVPYVQRAAAQGVAATVRSVPGWSLRYHRVVDTWPGSDVDSVADAAASDAAAVVLQLGTNDVACLHRAPNWCPATPEDDDPAHPAFVARQREAIRDEQAAAVDTLLAAGKCVVWAGPRRPATDGIITAEDVDWFNGTLRDLALAHPGRVHDAGYAAHVAATPALAGDFAAPESDGIHPRTAAARDALADLVLEQALAHCPVDRLAPPPAPDPPAGAPAPPAVAPPAAAEESAAWPPTAIAPPRSPRAAPLALGVSAPRMLTRTQARRGLRISLTADPGAVVLLRGRTAAGASAAAPRLVVLPGGRRDVTLHLSRRVLDAARRRPQTVTLTAAHAGQGRSLRIRVVPG